jgi:quercetin 2,3-dioxygenase
MDTPHERRVTQTIPSIAAADGAGVRLRRSLGQSSGCRFDPFLMLDEFDSENPDDYIAGFPAHPHRGFETVTCMLDGHMLHEDHLGNTGHLREGSVQWMTAGRGIVHSEMPQQNNGLMHGFQLWINLPAAEKMCDASYRDATAEEIPQTHPGRGVTVRHIAGRCRFSQEGPEHLGLFNGLDNRPRSTNPLLLDIHLAANTELEVFFPAEQQAFCYTYQGEPAIAGQTLALRGASLLSEGDRLHISAPTASRLLLLAGTPLTEPIAQYGPFVMNTNAEIEQALRDYRDGTLTATNV